MFMQAIYSLTQCLRQLTCLAAQVVTVVLLVAFAGSAWAESGTREPPSQTQPAPGASQRVYTEPNLTDTNPYLPFSHSHTKLPVAAKGYSVVALRDQQKWIEGLATRHVFFDGQIYWFANQREKDIFIAAPEKYAPVLGGDCLVSYSETGKRIPGDPRFGVVHRGRIYLFASELLRERFQNNTERYTSEDIAHNGNCIVCKVDLQKEIQGLPATVATVGGLRYYFAGSHQRATFGANPSRYGAMAMGHAQGSGSPAVANKAPPQKGDGQQKMIPAANAKDQQALADAKPLADEAANDEKEAIPDGKLAMEGYCPVSIKEQGIWVRGKLNFPVELNNKIYLLAGEEQKEKFENNPKLYLPILGGDCIVSLVEKEQRIAGSVFYSKQSKDKGQLFLFAGAKEKRSFEANPTAYLEAAKTEATPAQ
ncbi:MAG: hypothetical protein GXP26_00280 [Planctomycetes bacterium]|nr:hypothetical protein [Planctomycetota bacterium]